MKKVLRVLEKVEESVAAFFFVTGSLIAIYGVFMRYIFNSPASWTTEIFEMFMVIAIFIGFGMALKDDRHIVVDLLYDKMPPVVKRIFNIISNVLGAFFSIFLTIMGMQMVSIARIQGGATVDVGIPIWVTYLIMPIGMGLLAFYFLIRIVRSIRDPLPTEEQEERDRINNAI